MSKRLPSLSVDSSKIVQLVHYGQALAEMGMGFKALQQYDYALELNPKSPIVFHQKGLLYFQKEQYIHALHCYEQALLQANQLNIYFDKGNAHLALNQIDKAIECYTIAQQYFNNRKEVYYQLGVAHYQKNSIVTALRNLIQAIKLDPKYILALQKLGDIYYDLKMYKKALKTYDKILRIDGLNHKTVYSKGLIYFEINEKEKALACFEKCILLQPNNSMPYFNKGVICLQNNDYREALKNFKQSLNRNPQNYQAKFNLGLAYQKLGIFDKALLQYSKCQQTHEVLFNSGLIQQQFKLYYKSQDLFKKAIKQQSDKPEYWYNLGINYYFLDNISETANCFEKVIALGGLWIIEDKNIQHPAIIQYRQQFIEKPTNYINYYQQGRIYCLLNQFYSAIKSFQKSIELNSNFVQSKLELAKVYESLKQYKESILIYKEINNQQSYQQLSILLSHLQLHDATIYILNKILEIDPKNIEALYNKGLSLSQLNQYVLALQCFDEIIRMQPRYIEAIFQKGITLKQINENEKAQQQFSKILSFTPENEVIYLLQGHTHFHLQQYTDAISAYEKAIEINNSFNEAYFGLGFVHYTRKEYQLSIKIYKQYLQQFPKSKQFLLALANSFHKLGKNKSALKKLDEILVQDQYSSEAINCKAIIYYDLKNFKQSFINFQKAIQQKPKQNELLKYVYNS
ncbi:unnamed protein product [Paramecium pentaurelia]|uniref:UDP-N-acetylglucosamine--peptide N-acetylglucosaminyltransferase SPINDLY n=1 Tax=Paramecium pentaurelia TaxID=43138 RepID=A0A8S1V5H8_9CILI|nr:unnamed protein product [Paramecium pentaurelia]